MASSRSGNPRALHILTCERNGRVEVHEDALQEIFPCPEIQGKPVCIVSISGAFRKGKSFMLNFFIRYLRNNGHSNKTWMGNSDEPMEDGFDWKGGMDACTNGILMWNEVFVVKRKDEEVAVILMDTQGLFDNRTKSRTNSIVFALSTLISSVQIFNLTQQIQETDLGFLQFFTAYAEAARKASNPSDTKPFQSLIFLVRDWPHAVELPYGTDGGEKYLERVLTEESTSDELTSVRKHLRSSFEDIGCCLMPHPGLTVATTSHSFQGCVKDIDDEFVRHTSSFVDSLFQPRNLVVKKINGQVVSSQSILQYVSDCSASLTDGKLPDPKTMMENVAEAQNFEAQRRCRDKYVTNMKEIMGESFVDDTLLRDMHTQFSSSAMEEFASLTRFGSEESREKHRNYLMSTINREYGMSIQVNRSNKAEAEANMLRLVECVVRTYENDVKKAIGKDFISDEELDEIHGRFANEAFEAYSVDRSVNPQLRDKYSKILLGRLERTFQSLKGGNKRKREIAEEQDEKKRQMMKLELEYIIRFRETMRELVENFAENLDQLAEKHRRTAMDGFQIKALDLKVKSDSEIFQKQFSSLKSALEKEWKLIRQIKSEKEETLEKELLRHREKAIEEYENAFNLFLKDSYMEKNDLLEKHQEVVQKLMSSLRSAVRDKSQVPLVAKHMRETETELNNKHFMIEKWNEKNNTFLRKCFRVAGTILPNVMSVVRLVAEFKRLL